MNDGTSISLKKQTEHLQLQGAAGAVQLSAADAASPKGFRRVKDDS